MSGAIDRLPTFDEDGNLHVVVESPRGSTLKYEYDPERGAFAVGRSLPVGIAYPFDWGFVPGTLAEDGDPVDAMVLHDRATYPGVLLKCRVIGVVDLVEKEDGAKQKNPRIIVTPAWEGSLSPWTDARKLPAPMRRELESFFLHVTFFTGKRVRITGWRGRNAALKEVRSRVRES